MSRLIVLSLFTLILNLSCKHSTASDLRDEGLTKVTDISLNELIKKLKTRYQLNTEQEAALATTLPKLILATFKIYCGDGHGTGFFVGPHGEFITAGHVVNEDQQECEISKHFRDPANPDRFIKETITARLEVQAAVYDAYNLDLAKGTIVGIDTTAFLELDKAPLSLNSKISLAIGFPTATLRDGSESVPFKKEFLAKYRLICPKELKDYQGLASSFKKYSENTVFTAAEREQYHKSHLDFTRELKRIEAACSYMEEGGQRLPNISGYDLSDDDSTYISLGQLYFSDDTFFLGNHDTVAGMSGGPLVDLLSGGIIGLVSSGKIFQNDIQKYLYSPFTAFSRVNETTLASIAEQNKARSPACQCLVRYYREDGSKDSPILQSPVFRCLDSASGHSCENMNGSKFYSTVTEESSRVYSHYSDCKRVTIASATCNYYAGAKIRVIHDDGSSEYVTIAEEVGKYVHEWKASE